MSNRGSNTVLFNGFPEAKLTPIVCRVWKACMWTITESHTTEQQMQWPEKTFPGGWSKHPRLNSPPFSHLFAWLYGLGKEKASGFEDLVKSQKGVCAQYKHNKICGCENVCVCGFQPLFEVLHSTLAITSYQGLDEGEGKEERERWREESWGRGSRFREQTEKREKLRGEKRLRSLLSVFLSYKGGYAYFLNMS